MSVKSALDKVLATRTLEFPKERRGYDPAERRQHLHDLMRHLFAESFWETETAFVVECTHNLRPSATAADIDNVAKSLDIVVPEQLRQFWEICDGAELFVAKCKGEETRYRDAVVCYDIRGTSDTGPKRWTGDRNVIDLTRYLFKNFRECLGDDPGFKDMLKSNYIAFCDAYDGNNQAILLDGPEYGKVFMLHHEHTYCPHDEKDCILNDTLAPSFESWLRLLAETRGYGGRGVNVGSI